MHIEISAEKIFDIFGFPVTNTLLMAWLAVAILGFVAFRIYSKLSIIPSFVQNILEFVMEKILDLMEGIFGSREISEKYFPVIATIFLFIIVSNWIGILPGIGSIGFIEKSSGKEVFVPFFRSAASDLNFTLAIAISAVVLVHIFGILAIGVRKHISKFISFKSPIDFFVGLLEFISEIAKMISFSVRLFGNVFAGEVLLVVTAFLVPYLIPVPFLMLELFVGFIQALVFSMLTMVFISIAIAEHR